MSMAWALQWEGAGSTGEKDTGEKNDGEREQAALVICQHIHFTFVCIYGYASTACLMAVLAEGECSNGACV